MPFKFDVVFEGSLSGWIQWGKSLLSLHLMRANIIDIVTNSSKLDTVSCVFFIDKITQMTSQRKWLPLDDFDHISRDGHFWFGFSWAVIQLEQKNQQKCAGNYCEGFHFVTSNPMQVSVRQTNDWNVFYILFCIKRHCVTKRMYNVTQVEAGRLIGTARANLQSFSKV